MRKRLLSAALALILMALPFSAMAAENPYRDLLLAQDYGDGVTYVIGHKSPDSDAVGSAMAYAYLLNAIGIWAEPVVSGRVNNETAYALDAFGLEAPPVMDRAGDNQFILVDHSEYAQAIDGMEDARVVGIVDHHGIGNVKNSELINVRSAPIGATASLVYLMYRECAVDVPRDMARVMLMSILSDTRNMTKRVTAFDRIAYDALLEIADIEDVDALYQGMADALSSYEGMTEMEIFRSDYKEYEESGVRFGIANVNAFGEEAVRDMADRMLDVMAGNFDGMGLDMLFAIVKNKGGEKGENKMYMVAWGDGAEDVLQEAFGNFDGERYFVFRKKLSRKEDVVPAIDAVLKASRKGS